MTRPAQPPADPPEPAEHPRSKLAAAAHAISLKHARQKASAAAARGGSSIRFVRSAALEAQRTRLPQMAAALSYRTIFGMIPVLFIALVALKIFVSDKEMSSALHSILQFSGLSSISVEEGHFNAATMMGPFPEHITPPAAIAAEPEEPVRAHLDQWITTLVERIDSINFRAVSIIGLLALIYAALAMLVEIERSFNQIYRVPVGRSWPRRIAQYWTLLTLGAIFLAATFYIGQQFTRWLTEAGHWGPEQAAMIAGAGYLTTVAISTVLFLLAYTIVPNTRVRLLPALCGALVAAVLWETSKWGFTHYLTYSAGYARLYGSIALIPLFLLWVYVTWAIVLFGLSVSYYLQHGRTATRRARAAASEVLAPASPAIVDPGAILALMLILAGRFEKDGRPADLPRLASELAIDRALVGQMLERLVAAGFVHQVARSAETGGDPLFVLARPPEQIDAESVLNLAEGLVCPLSKAAQPVSQCMRRARHEAIRGRSLAWFLSDGASGPAATGVQSMPLVSALAASSDKQ